MLGGRIECTMQNVADLLVNRRSSTISPEEHGSHPDPLSIGAAFDF